MMTNRKLAEALQTGSIVRVTSGKYKGHLARVLPYPGQWVYVEFLDPTVTPRDKHFPPGSVGEVSAP